MGFQFHYSGPTESDGWLLVAAICAVFAAGALLVRLALFVMRAIGLYTIANRRGLNNPWLVWIPVANSWMIGSFSDQYRYLVKDEIKNKRKLLLGFAVANAVMEMVTFAIMLGLYCEFLPSGSSMSDGQIAAMMMNPALIASTISSVFLVTRLVEFVLRKVCLYDLYRSCDPGNESAFLILSVVFPFLEAIFLIALRNRDDGMPPRRKNTVETIG